MILHINQPGKNRISFRLENTQEQTDEPVWPEYMQTISGSFLNELIQHGRKVLRASPRSGLIEEMKELGLMLFENIFPLELRQKLTAHQGPLYLWTEMNSIPWELLYDENQFWGIKYSMGRKVIKVIKPMSDRQKVSVPDKRDPGVLIIASNPNNDLNWLQDEVETIISRVSQFAEVNVISGERATVLETSRELRKGYSIVHYCGHAVKDHATNESALLLHEGRLLDAVTIKSNMGGSPVVFINACQSARGNPEYDLTSEWDDMTSCLSDAFLYAGAAGVIGTVADVGDLESAMFANHFYERIYMGSSLGEAIQSTRKSFAENLPDNPVWSSFVLYGNPASSIRRNSMHPIGSGNKKNNDASNSRPAGYSTGGNHTMVHGSGNQASQTEISPQGKELEDTVPPVILQNRWQETLSEIKPAILYVETMRGEGTGFLVGDGKYAITCHHVVRNFQNIKLHYFDGRTVNARVLGSDPNRDLAILELENIDIKYSMRIAETAPIQEGQEIYAIGHPLGFSFTATKGNVSNRCRVINNTSYVQTDASLNPGNSGGPIIRENGDVVGVVSFGVGGAQGLGFGVATPHIRSMLAKYRIKNS